MTQPWQHTVDVRNLWEKAKNNEITPKEAGYQLALKLRYIPNRNNDLHEVSKRFQQLDTQSSWDDFDVILNDLYDWCDYNKRVWIKTR